MNSGASHGGRRPGAGRRAGGRNPNAGRKPKRKTLLIDGILQEGHYRIVAETSDTITIESIHTENEREGTMNKHVQIYTEVSDGQGDVVHAWTDGTIVSEIMVQPGMKSHGNSAGIIVNAPGAAYKNKNIFVADDLISTVIR